MPATVLDALGTVDGTLPAIDDGTLRLSYADVHRSVAAERRWLQSMRVRRCALLAENSARWILSDLALLACEAVNVPLPASFTREQVAHVLDDADIEWVLTDQAEHFMGEHPTFAYVNTSHRTGLALLKREACRSEAGLRASDLGKVTYTSGSTGASKGVCLRRAVIQLVTDSLVAATAGLGVQTHLCLLPLATLLENVAGVYVPLTMGAKVLVPPGHTMGVSYSGLNAPLLLKAIDSASPESMILVPELLRVLVYAARDGWRAPVSLKFIAVGGGGVAPALLQEARRAGLPVFQGYGLSECASVVCLNTPKHDKPDSVGRPLPHARVRIDDNGEICVSGATMAGYLGDSRRQAGEVRTGDLGAIDADGFVYVRGRLKNMFITSMGRNVTPEWVEGELNCEPAIAQAMVSGEARPYPVALIVGSANAREESITQAIGRANARLPDYARIRGWAFFPEAPTLSNGLLTANGRLRRAEIAAKYHQLIDSIYDQSTDTVHAIQ
ncbi:AMP-binding protein [Peristeroidobacter agariperforans]|uniref:AMP-binding protein n=1 Tax=Peristeroidobacter agariperforans TaxID=268404 RepID=UPI00101D5ADC|nr:AMP-binding protein [Peristeroidobacter agariperforans]